MRGIRRTEVYATGFPLGGTATVTTAGPMAPIPVWPIIITMPVRAGSIYLLCPRLNGNSAGGATTVFAQVFIGGVAYSTPKSASVASAYGYQLTWTEAYIPAADNAAVTFEIYALRGANNFTVTTDSGMQIIQLGV